MNIVEAIKSGRCIRRKGWPDLLWWATEQSYYQASRGWTMADLVAEDWEVQGPTDLTTAKFWKVAGEVLADHEGCSTRHVLSKLAKALGL